MYAHLAAAEGAEWRLLTCAGGSGSVCEPGLMTSVAFDDDFATGASSVAVRTGGIQASNRTAEGGPLTRAGNASAGAAARTAARVALRAAVHKSLDGALCGPGQGEGAGAGAGDANAASAERSGLEIVGADDAALIVGAAAPSGIVTNAISAPRSRGAASQLPAAQQQWRSALLTLQSAPLAALPHRRHSINRLPTPNTRNDTASPPAVMQ